MINILLLTFSLNFMKLLIEDSLLLILMTMEMISMTAYFLILNLNSEALGLTACVITMLTILVSESVLGLSIFINLMRSSSTDKIHSPSVSKY